MGGTTPSTAIEEYWNGDVVWVTPSDLGRMASPDIVTSGRRITDAGFMAAGLEMVPAGSVVLSTRAPIGHLGIARVPVCTNQGCKCLVPGRDTDSEFLYFALRLAVPDLQALGSGATFKEVSKDAVENYEVPLPTIPEQKRIARILNEQMQEVEKARKATEAQLAAARALPAAYLRGVFESPEAKQWPRKRLGDVCDVVSKGTTPTTLGYAYTATGVPFLRAEDVMGAAVDPASVQFHVSAQTDAVLARSHLHPGDLLVTIAGTLGRVGFIPDGSPPMNCNQAVAFARLKRDAAEVRYVCWACQSPATLKPLLGLGVGGAIQNLSLAQVRELALPLPTLAQQREVASALDGQLSRAQRLRAGIEARLAEIDKLPAALLRRAFAGEKQ